MKRLMFSDLNDRLQAVFGNEDNYEGFRNLTYDLAHGVEIFDEEGARVSNVDANAKVRNYVFNILGINEKSTKRDRKRAMKKYGTELFEVIEEVIDIKVEPVNAKAEVSPVVLLVENGTISDVTAVATSMTKITDIPIPTA